jgi:hypothetical protein
MAHQDVAGVGPVVAVEAAHQRRFARTRRAGQRHALALAHIHADIGQDRDTDAALQMQGEAFRKSLRL